MRYKKKLNNNVIVAVDDLGNEKILMGCGLGFQKNEGALVEESKIEKVFDLADPNMNEQLKQLLKDIPMEYMQLTNQIVSYAQIHVNNKIRENVVISLCDHIYTAIERKKLGIDVRNVLLWDIKKYYRDEYGVGTYAVGLILERFGIGLAEDEAGFIALHIVNAELDVKSNSVKEITTVIQELETIVRMTFKITLDLENVYYYRFITHLKFFAERLFSGKTYEKSDVSRLLEVVVGQYPDAYQCSRKIAAFIEDKYRYHLSDEELMYLSIHIARIAAVS